MLLRGAVLLALGASSLATAEGLKPGEWDSPVGRLRVEVHGTSVAGTVVKPASNACASLTPGTLVLKGDIDDDSFTGQVRLCLEGAQCVATDSWLHALLVMDGRGETLAGAVEKGNAQCHARLERSGAVTLRRRGDRPASSAAPVADPAKRSAARSLISEGAQLIDDGRFEVARERFQASLAASPLPEAFNGIGVTYYARKQYDDALRAYKQALLLDPGFGDAYYNMACIYALIRRKDLALQYLRLAVRNGYKDLSDIEQDPDLASLRDDPRFNDLRKRYTPGG